MASNQLNPINILDSSNATGIGTGGSLTVGGGASIARDFFIGGNLSVSGTTSSFSDNILVLNKNPGSSKDTGILLERYTNDISNNQNYSGIIYSETSDEFVFGYASADGTSLTFNNYIPIKSNKVVIMSTENSIGLGSGGSLTVLGGSSIEKTLYANSISTNAINTMGSIITTGGNVGIGNINPIKKLDINGDLNFTGDLYKNGMLFNPGSQWQSISEGIFYNGNVGIGTTSPTRKLDISGDINFTGDLYKNNTLFEAGSQWKSISNNLAYTVGNVGIGTTSPVFTLDINGTLKASNTNGTILFNSAGNVGIGTSSPNYKLVVAGDIYATGDVIVYSDERLKTDITTIQNALQLVESMRGVNYTMIETGKRKVGLIAQEVQQILPEVVSEKEHLGVAYGNIVGVLVEAIKELKCQNDKLTLEYNELKTFISNKF